MAVPTSKEAIEQQLSMSFVSYQAALAEWNRRHPYQAPPGTPTTSEYIAAAAAAQSQQSKYAGYGTPTQEEYFRQYPERRPQQPTEFVTELGIKKYDVGVLPSGQTEQQYNQLLESREKAKQNMSLVPYQAWANRYLPHNEMQVFQPPIGAKWDVHYQEFVGNELTGEIYPAEEIPRARHGPVYSFMYGAVNPYSEKFSPVMETYIPENKQLFEKTMKQVQEEPSWVESFGKFQNMQLGALGLLPSEKPYKGEYIGEAAKGILAFKYVTLAPQLPWTLGKLGAEYLSEVVKQADMITPDFGFHPERLAAPFIAIGALGGKMIESISEHPAYGLGSIAAMGYSMGSGLGRISRLKSAKLEEPKLEGAEKEPIAYDVTYGIRKDIIKTELLTPEELYTQSFFDNIGPRTESIWWTKTIRQETAPKISPTVTVKKSELGIVASNNQLVGTLSKGIDIEPITATKIIELPKYPEEAARVTQFFGTRKPMEEFKVDVARVEDNVKLIFSAEKATPQEFIISGRKTITKNTLFEGRPTMEMSISYNRIGEEFKGGSAVSFSTSKPIKLSEEGVGEFNPLVRLRQPKPLFSGLKNKLFPKYEDYSYLKQVEKKVTGRPGRPRRFAYSWQLQEPAGKTITENAMPLKVRPIYDISEEVFTVLSSPAGFMSPTIMSPTIMSPTNMASAKVVISADVDSQSQNVPKQFSISPFTQIQGFQMKQKRGQKEELKVVSPTLLSLTTMNQKKEEETMLAPLSIQQNRSKMQVPSITRTKLQYPTQQRSAVIGIAPISFKGIRNMFKMPKLPSIRRRKGGLNPLADYGSLTITEMKLGGKATQLKPTKRLKKLFGRKLHEEQFMLSYPTLEMSRGKI